jgi:hypothetical protein
MGDIDDRRLLISDLPEQAFRGRDNQLTNVLFFGFLFNLNVLAIRPPVEDQHPLHEFRLLRKVTSHFVSAFV